MNSIPSREFQLTYQRLDEPCVVTARSRTLGTWYPKGTEPDSEADAFAEIKHLKLLLAELTARSGFNTAPATSAPAVRAGYNNAPFSPAPKKEK